MGGDDRAGVNRRLVKQGRKISLGKCRKIHPTGSDPSGLGMMQPEGSPSKVSYRHKQKGYMPQGRTHAAWE